MTTQLQSIIIIIIIIVIIIFIGQSWRTYCAREPKMALGKISLAHNIHCCPSFCYLFYPTIVSILRTIHVYIHTYLTPYRLYVNYCCYQITLQWNTFPQIWTVRSVDWIFIVVAPVWRWLGQYVTLGRAFCCLLLWQVVVVAAAQLLPHCVT